MRALAALRDAISQPITITAIRPATLEKLGLRFLFFIIALGLLSPLSSLTQIPNRADYINHLAALIQTKQAFQQGQFPLRTMSWALDQLGYPLYQFYSPTAFLLMGIVYVGFTPTNPLLAMQIVMVLGLMAAGLSMYHLAYWFIRSKPAALLAGIAYLYTPYYIVLVEHLASIQEVLALGVLPAVVCLTLQCYYQPRNLFTHIKLSAMVAILVTLHLPTAVYGMMFTALLLLITTVQHPKRLRALTLTGLSYAFAGCLLMWFLAPALLCQHYFVISNTYSDATHLTRFHPTSANLLFPAAALTAGFKGNALQGIHPNSGLPLLLAAATCFIALKRPMRTGKRRADFWMPGILLLFCIAFFLVWSPINVWQWLPQPLWLAQFSTRLLAQVIWLGALLFAWAIYWLYAGDLNRQRVVLIGVLLVVCVQPWFVTADYWDKPLAEFMRAPAFVYNQDALTIDYNKYPEWIASVDSVVVDASQQLLLNNVYSIPLPLQRLAHQPVLVLRGELTQPRQLAIQLNQTLVQQRHFAAGHFEWNIPLTFSPKNQVAELIVRDTQAAEEKGAIPMQAFLLRGFQPLNSVMTLSDVKPLCHWRGATQVCQVAVPAGVKRLALPQLFYPQLLRVTLNGRDVSYQGMLAEGYLVAAITPFAGQVNRITTTFRGLPWANTISVVAWVCWVLVVMVGWLRARLNQK